MIIRRLRYSDYREGYLNLVNQLSPPEGEITETEFNQQVDLVKRRGIEIYVIEKDGQLVAGGSLIIEPKFIHRLGKVGHIEDIVVDRDYRGQGLAQEIINYLKNRAFQQGCYKVILDCYPELVRLYQHCGFREGQVQMSIYGKDAISVTP